ncbi:MAG: hypothetical protein WDZ76_03360 [Pseudohongiellaceae bacterium]
MKKLANFQRIIHHLHRFTVVALLVVFSGITFADPAVEVLPTPNEGMQPRLLTGSDGTVHLMYFKKRLNNPRAREGDLYYQQYNAQNSRWSVPVRISSQSFSYEYAIGRAAFAIDGEGRVHVAWYQSRPAQYFYTRYDPGQNRFEDQRSLVADYLEGVDAGADIAARGNFVAVVWGAGALTREEERTVFARFSTDHGASFGEELILGDRALGACACCSLAADFTEEYQLKVAYRSAIDGVGRGMQILTVSPNSPVLERSRYAGVHELQQWELSACPLSTNDVVDSPQGSKWLVFETRNRIVQMGLDGVSEPALVGEPLTETRQKNPAIGFNHRGEKLIAWGEAISYVRGGALNMQLFDAEGNEMAKPDFADIAVGDHSFPAVAALPDGSFLVLY